MMSKEINALDALCSNITNSIGKEIKEITDEFPLKEIKDSAEDLISAYKWYETISNIPTQIYMKKYMRFCKGLREINREMAETYIKRLGNEKIKKEVYIILEVINKIEEDDKIPYINDIFRARVENKISAEEYRRMLIYVSHTLVDDLLYMINHVSNDVVPMDSAEIEGLVSSGWLVIVNMGKQRIHEDDDVLYRYNTVAVKFCEIVKQYRTAL